MKNNLRIILLLASFSAFIDQLTKYFVTLYVRSPLEIIPDFFRLQYVENVGVAFSIPIPYPLLMLANVLLIGLIVYIADKELDLSKRLSQVTVALVLGGGFGNLIDRLVNGYVVDFISIWKYPLFNFADICITVGVLLILLFYAKIKPIKDKQNG